MARGPAYPFVNLEEAVEYSKKLFNFARRSSISADVVVQEAWKYSAKSSGGQKVLAALKYFGLTEDVANSPNRTIRLSDRGYRILVDSPNSEERKQALRDAFLSPKSYAYCWNMWGNDLVPSMRSKLIFDEGFIDSTVDAFIKDYRQSLEFSGIASEPAIGSMKNFPEEHDKDNEEPNIEAFGESTQKAQYEPEKPSSVIASGMRHDSFSLPKGLVTLTWPHDLDEDSFVDLSDWLDLIKRKIGRSVVKLSVPESESE